jgi:uncharacterized membrane protein YesL
LQGKSSVSPFLSLCYTPLMPLGPLITRIYKKSFWNTYDNIGKLIVLNLLWFLIFPLPTFLAFRYLPLPAYPRIALTVVIGLLTHSYATSGVFALTARLADYREVAARSFFGAAKTYFARMLGLGLIFGTLFFVLFQSTRFYLNLKAAGGILGFFLAGIQVWIAAFALLMQVYLFPLLVMRGWGIGKTIKWSAMLVVLKPGLTVLMFLQAFAIFLLVGITGVGIVVLLMSLTGILLNTNLRETLKEIEETTEPKRKPTSWKEIFEEQEKKDEETRTLKDILRPWDT